jgi:hypothetical protein
LYDGWTTTKQYHAILGEYGVFEMEITADGSAMNWQTTLTKMANLATAIGASTPITSLKYHLHTQWTAANADLGVGGTECGGAITGGHYDPFYACGPASAVPPDQCTTIGRPTASYSCSPASYFTNNQYDSCEVGDLSGKGGALTVNAAGAATGAIAFDPSAALVSHYQVDRVATTAPNRFASIVFHGDGGARVLCAKLVAGKLPADEGDDDDEENVGFIAKILGLLLPCF